MLRIQFGQEAVSSSSMDWAELVSSLASSLAWPVGAVIIALAFRGAIVTLLSKVKKVGFGGATLEIGEVLDRAETKAEQDPAAADEAEIDLRAGAAEVLNLPPEAIVMLEWREVERLISNIIKSQGLEPKKMSPAARRQRLARGQSISDVTISIIEDLAKIRNGVTHGSDISRPEAVRFFELSQQVQADLRKATHS